MRSAIGLLLVTSTLVTTGCGSEPPAASPRPSQPAREAAAASPGWKTDFSRHIVPLGEFESGGPGKDGIPALSNPRLVPARAVDFIASREPMIEFGVGRDVRAYPLQIMVWHELVNDRVGGVPVLVTFCPLCNTAIAFDRRVRGRTLDFGTTGKLRKSDLVMYDRQTESWWQQFGGEAVVGRYAGKRLRQLPARIVSWDEFRRNHPEGLVLMRDTGHSRDYGQNPYSGYDDVSSSPIFPAAHAADDRLPPKERVVFVEHAGRSAVVPYSVLGRRKVVRIRLGGRLLDVRWRGGVASALDDPSIPSGRDVGAADVFANGRRVVFSEPFWFAVAAFRPDVIVRR